MQTVDHLMSKFVCPPLFIDPPALITEHRVFYVVYYLEISFHNNINCIHKINCYYMFT